MTDREPDLLGGLAPFVGDQHRSTIAVLVAVMRTGRQMEAWLSATLAADELDTSEFTALVTLLIGGEPYRRAAGELSSSLVQTTGGTTKTIRRLEERGLVTRVSDPADGRRSLIELTEHGRQLSESTLDLVLDAFDLEIGDLGEAERTELGAGLVRLSLELDDRLGNG
ncbi:MAG: MarR family transcriptional regulator [Actinomycetota bacterium]